MDHTLLDPLDEQFRWCIYCGADCWPEGENQRHDLDCPRVTGLYPVDRLLLAAGARCSEGCGHQFQQGDHYGEIPLHTDGPDKTVAIACLPCAVLAAT
jgi:hypothetical protein